MDQGKTAFDEEKYLLIQKKAIIERINSFGSKLYLEFGGKLFEDFHASRVLPGYSPNSKVKLLQSLRDEMEVIIVVNTKDINSSKVRSDFGITYRAEAERMIEAYSRIGLPVNSVVLSFYEDSQIVKEFAKQLKNLGIKVYKHYQIPGYPQDIPLITSEKGLGKNEYIQTTKPLIVVTAPGPGSGKMATCLSQLYHDNKNGIRAGYAKYETFPVWDLPLNHPVNLAYESATADLNDVNMIDPYHLEAYSVTATNYNRDIESFPLLKSIFDAIYGKSPYKSPTDMGVNKIGAAIVNEEAAIEASKAEIIRRYYQVLKFTYLGKFPDDSITKVQMLMNKLSISIKDRKCIEACLKKQEQCDEPSMAIELNNGKIVTGRRSDLLGAPAAALLNALKTLANIDDDVLLISPELLKPIVNVKTTSLHNLNPRLHPEEVLIALAISASSNPNCKKALDKLPLLCGAQAHSSYILQEVDLSAYEKLGLNVTEEPKKYVKRYARNN